MTIGFVMQDEQMACIHRGLNGRRFILVHEGYRYRLIGSLYHRRPSLWMFIRTLKDLDAATERSARQAERGVPPPAKKRKWRQMDQRIRRLKRDYTSGVKTVTEYWAAIMLIIHNFV